jgi:UPF0755 protein
MLKKIGIAAAVVVVLVGIFIGPKISVFFAGQSKTINQETKDFYFNAITGLEGLANQLTKEGIIDDKSDFLKVGEYKNLDNSTLASGRYRIEPGTNFRTLLNGFTKNSAGNGNAEVEVEVTFNNCRDVYQLAGKVSKMIMIDSAKLVSEILNPSMLDRLNLTAETVPALFLPNTYRMFYDVSPEAFIERMEANYTAFWSDERLAKLKKVGMKKPYQAVTLASIVYSEQAKNSEEWPIIAGLYLNRLKQDMKLQSDPTFKFCWGDELKGVQRLTFEHREIDCDYNTYKHLGLPPGPICIPPSEVVDAVLNPDKNEFLYMCAKPDYTGRHDFTVTYEKHKVNATKFQRWIAKQ